MRRAVLSMLLIALFALPLQAQLSSPSIVGPKSSNRTETTPTLNWQELDNATWYHVWIRNTTQGTVHHKAWIKGSNSWTIPEKHALNPGDTYRWWVAGWNLTDGKGDWGPPEDFEAGRVRYKVIGAARFHDANSSNLFYSGAGFKLAEELGGGFIREPFYISHTGTDPGTSIYTDFTLPENAVPVQFRTNWRDNDSGDNLRVEFDRVSNSDGGGHHIATASSSGSADTNSNTTTSISGASPSDPSTHTYGLWLRFPNTGNSKDIRFYSARIKYIK